MDGFKNSTRTQYMKGGSCDGYAKGGKVKGAAKISKVMGEFKSGTLHSGSKKGAEVTNPKQAVAIALSEARKAGANVPMAKAKGGKVHTYSAKAAAAGKDLGKKGKAFGKIAEEAGEKYGSKAAGERVAGAALNKLRNKYREGGEVEGVSARPMRNGRRATDAELGVGDDDRASIGSRLRKLTSDPYERMPADLSAGATRKPRSVTVERTTVSEEPTNRTPLARRLSQLPSERGEMGRSKGYEGWRSIPIIGDVGTALGFKKGGLSAMPKGKKC